ncbi:hypothetical protein ANO14919_122420 [Xylariales sp. No.14919]|nr:hypothetical protein ANO14919_122420 [Xylariales sp. No.14919]
MDASSIVGVPHQPPAAPGALVESAADNDHHRTRKSRYIESGKRKAASGVGLLDSALGGTNEIPSEDSKKA